MKLKTKLLMSLIVMLMVFSCTCVAAEKKVISVAPAVPIVPITPVVPTAPAVPIVPITPAAPTVPVVPAAPTRSAVHNIGYIFIGDSRMKGIDYFGGLSENSDIWVLSDVSRGYKYLTEQAATDISALENSNPQISTWYEIYALGLNDIGNKDKYCQWYQNRAMAHKVIVVSVDPIEQHRSINNEMISAFNASLAMTGLKYIDSNRYLINSGFATSDGVHFKNETSKKLAAYLAGRARAIGN